MLHSFAAVISTVPLDWKQQDIRPEMYECNSSLSNRTGCHTHIISSLEVGKQLIKPTVCWIWMFLSLLHSTTDGQVRKGGREDCVGSAWENVSVQFAKNTRCSQYRNAMCFPYMNYVPFICISFFFFIKSKKKRIILENYKDKRLKDCLQ